MEPRGGVLEAVAAQVDEGLVRQHLPVPHHAQAAAVASGAAGFLEQLVALDADGELRLQGLHRGVHHVDHQRVQHRRAVGLGARAAAAAVEVVEREPPPAAGVLSRYGYRAAGAAVRRRHHLGQRLGQRHLHHRGDHLGGTDVHVHRRGIAWVQDRALGRKGHVDGPGDALVDRQVRAQHRHHQAVDEVPDDAGPEVDGAPGLLRRLQREVQLIARHPQGRGDAVGALLVQPVVVDEVHAGTVVPVRDLCDGLADFRLADVHPLVPAGGDFLRAVLVHQLRELPEAVEVGLGLGLDVPPGDLRGAGVGHDDRLEVLVDLAAAVEP